ncbi:MAG: UDP-N-acetyl-D-glucosamine dehydrogenase, partial [Frankiaceae bacterium]|nr:UDP-N-acetyl-D-glucosamine dehydrogenase [Frankiaceae bacterium]
DHAEYRTLSPERVPGVRALVDGRGVTDPTLWAGIPRAVIGDGGPKA